MLNIIVKNASWVFSWIQIVFQIIKWTALVTYTLIVKMVFNCFEINFTVTNCLLLPNCLIQFVCNRTFASLGVFWIYILKHGTDAIRPHVNRVFIVWNIYYSILKCGIIIDVIIFNMFWLLDDLIIWACNTDSI